jgi:hypothetical protein
MQASRPIQASRTGAPMGKQLERGVPELLDAASSIARQAMCSSTCG